MTLSAQPESLGLVACLLASERTDRHVGKVCSGSMDFSGDAKWIVGVGSKKNDKTLHVCFCCRQCSAFFQSGIMCRLPLRLPRETKLKYCSYLLNPVFTPTVRTLFKKIFVRKTILKVKTGEVEKQTLQLCWFLSVLCIQSEPNWAKHPVTRGGSSSLRLHMKTELNGCGVLLLIQFYVWLTEENNKHIFMWTFL